MNERIRLGLLVVIFVVAGVGMWVALFGESRDDEVSVPTAPSYPSDESPSADPVGTIVEPEVEGNVSESSGTPAFVGSVISGRVYDVETFEGVEGAVIILRSVVGAQEDVVEVISDVGGNYSFEGLAEGTYRVSRGEAAAYIDDHLEDRSLALRIVALGFESVSDGIDFGVKRGLVLSGIVVDGDGIGIDAVKVWTDGRRDMFGKDTLSAEDGSFRLTGLLPDDAYGLRVSREGFGQHHASFVTPSTGEIGGYRIVLLPEARIEGIVVDERGNPLAEYRVSAQPNDPASRVMGNMKTGDDGLFAFGQFTAGSYTLKIRVKGADKNLSEPVEVVRLKAGSVVSGIRLVHRPSAGPFIEGTVTDSRGRPIKDAGVWARVSDSGEVKTDDRGHYRIAGLDHDYYLVIASAEGYSSQGREDVLVNSSNIDFVLLRPAKIEGQIISARTGEPITEFRMGRRIGTSIERPLSQFDLKPRKDPEGRFSFEKLNTDGLTIAVRAPGHQPKQVRVDGLEENEVRSDIRIVLDPGTILRGVVRNERGEPLASASVSVFLSNQEKFASKYKHAYTDTDGGYEFDSLYPDSVMVAVKHEDYSPQTLAFEVRSRDNRLNVTLRQGASLRGRVRIGNQPAAGFDVAVHYIEQTSLGFNRTTKTDAEGYFEVSNLYSGRARITASQYSPNTRASLQRWEDVVIPEQGSVRVNLDLRPLNASIEGFLYGESNVPVAGGVRVRNEDDGSAYGGQARVGADGYYRIDELVAGSYILSANDRGDTRRQVNVQLNADETVRRDIWLNEGVTASVIVSDLPAGTSLTRVGLYRGALEFPEPAREYLRSFERDKMTEVSLRVGSVSFPGLEPGTYTVHVQAFLGDEFRDPLNQYDGMSTATEVFTIESEGEEVSLDLSF